MLKFNKKWIEHEGRPYVIAKGYFNENGIIKLLTYYRNKIDSNEWGTELYQEPNYSKN